MLEKPRRIHIYAETSEVKQGGCHGIEKIDCIDAAS